MYVIKESGLQEKFDAKKLKISILSAGAPEDLANKAIREVKNKLYPGIMTREILHAVLDVLREQPGIAQRYNLKRAIMVLGPTGFPFEKFVARLLREYGYETATDVYVRGRCVNQEIDVTARKDGRNYMVECKYHNMPGKRSDLKVAMYTYARFLDVHHRGFDQAWLVTNTKCTSEAINYARCMNIRIIGWSYPKEECLEKLLIQKNIYPITSLESLSLETKQRLVRANLMLINDLLKNRMFYLRMKTRLPRKVIENLRQEARHIIGI